MGKMTYKEQLLHPNWQRKRLEVLESANFSCMSCRDGDRTLHVHHRRYVKGRMAWEYELNELQALCEACHAEQHEQRELLEQLLMTGGERGGSIEWVVGMLAGYQWVLGELDAQLEADYFRGGPFDPAFYVGAIAGIFGRLEQDRMLKLALLLDRGRLTPPERQLIDWLAVVANSDI